MFNEDPRKPTTPLHSRELVKHLDLGETSFRANSTQERAFQLSRDDKVIPGPGSHLRMPAGLRL